MKSLASVSDIIMMEGFESTHLKSEIEDIFCKVDKNTDGMYYSGARMEQQYPEITKLYRELNK